MIRTQMSGRDIDWNLRQILDAMNTENNDKVIYIKRGTLAFENGEVLFDVTELESE